MTAVVRASLSTLCSWGTPNLGAFVIGSSLIGGTDTLQVSPDDPTFHGTYDDISAAVRGYTITRGRGTNLGEMQEGSASIQMDDPLKVFNPADPAGPLYNVLDDRLHPVRLIQSYNGVAYPRFWGWARAPVYTPGTRKGTLTLDCVDMWYWLDRVNPIIPSTGPTTTGAALGLILNAAGWPALQRILDTGDNLPDFSADGSLAATQIVTNLLQSEGGAMWQDVVGNAVYRDRLYRLTRTSLTTLTDEISGFQPTGSQDDVYNQIIITRTQTGHVSTATNTISTDKIGFNTLSFESAYFVSDAAQDARALWILQQESLTRSPAYNLTIDSRDDFQMTQLLARDLVDRVTVDEDAGDSLGDYHLDGLTETGADDGSISVAYTASAVSTIKPFQIGLSTIGGTDVFS